MFQKKNKTNKKLFIFLSFIGVCFLLVFLIISIGMKKLSPTFFKAEIGQASDPRFSFSRKSPNILEKMLGTNNFTNNAIQKYGFQIALQNSNGPQNGSLLFPSQITLENAFKDELNKSIEFSAISEQDLRIINDNSTTTVRNYLKKIQEIAIQEQKTLQKKQISLNTIANQNNWEDLEETGHVFNDFSNELLDVTVPESWKTFHLQYINQHRKKSAIISALAAIENDPLKTIIATRELKLLNDEESVLAKTLLEKIQSANL